ncbi:hypothetical protein [Flagellimonas pacifica]|uniref:Uncharacterized protein n=1 Tax=Flagellimonas pacifica TaxID=1247520 RepID=A0A285MZY8_9FLAO|nr:hypothetical protein [Allomuricauda parva]SNZ01071.1 hypothetical protein SAMN06265377_2901 [Allomuricauda parva]
MKKLWCWRCKMEIPMLNEEEYAIAHKLYLKSFKRRISGMTREEGFKPLLDYYREITGFEETEPNAIMHHRIAQYGPSCQNCGKPYRTPEAKMCADCGNKRSQKNQ